MQAFGGKRLNDDPSNATFGAETTSPMINPVSGNASVLLNGKSKGKVIVSNPSKVGILIF